jgi:hypothetical protein
LWFFVFSKKNMVAKPQLMHFAMQNGTIVRRTHDAYGIIAQSAIAFCQVKWKYLKLVSFIL